MAPQVKCVWRRNQLGSARRGLAKLDAGWFKLGIPEIPTPRWTAGDALSFGVEIPDEVPITTQERAYPSPICYTPRG